MQRASLSTTLLVIAIMMLTFLNLVFVNGILVGLIEGASRDYEQHYSGQVLITTLPEKQFIERSTSLVQALQQHADVETFAPRYIEQGIVEANYLQTTKTNTLRDTVSAELVGIDLAREELTTQLSEFVTVGGPLSTTDEEMVIIGAELLEEYSPISFAGFETVSGVEPGDKVRILLNGEEKIVTVKGILESKSGPLERRVLFPDRELRQFIGRTDFNVDEIAVVLRNGVAPEDFVSNLYAQGFGSIALIQTSEDSQGTTFIEIAGTFGTLGNVIGSIGLAVAAITVFIVIFINAITRQRYIGIMKAIGINRTSIEFAYMFLAIAYAVVGTLLGLIILYVVLVPYFAANPIDFPFSNGILAVTPSGVGIRMALLLLATMIAGYIPARLIAGGNTLEAILRK